MKILLTGKPGVGKSTILQKVKQKFNGATHGIVSREIRGDDEKRVGFEAFSATGKSKVFAHVNDITSEFVMGGKYYVDLEVIDNFVVPEIQRGLIDNNSLILIDEIGRMQSFSKKFLQTVTDLLNSNANVLATIVYDPEPWSIAYKEHPQSILVNVDEKNRDLLPDILIKIFNNANSLEKLNKNQLIFVNEITKTYFSESKYIQLGKLFNNAIYYLIGGKVEKIGDTKFEVLGNHGSHALEITDSGEFTCDCDLYHGKKEYEENSGECSHIQAVKLYKLK